MTTAASAAGQIGKAEILAITKGQVHPQLLEMIERAGRTCYKSGDRITAGSADKFIASLIKSGHESVLEHSWIVFSLRRINPQMLLDLLIKQKLFSLTRRASSYHDFLLSGNARMFRDYLRSKGGLYWPLDLAMLDILKQTAPALFADLSMPKDDDIIGLDDEIIELASEPKFTREEKLQHWWAMAKFTGCSRVFTHQLVRHRLMAISQESQRYCDEGDFASEGYFVLPPSIEQAGLAEDYAGKLWQISNWYQELRVSGDVKKEDARFLLPNAVCSEIVISCNLREWRHIFKMRCDRHAQWEIRQPMLGLLKEFQRIFPDCFDDFQFQDDGESACPAG